VAGPATGYDESVENADGVRVISIGGRMYRKRAVALGLGRIVALYHRSSTLYQIREDIRCLYF
jgi:hypothetical protein